MKELTPKQRAFADYYIESGNAEKSAVKAGYSVNYARAHAHDKLLANVGISAYIAERLKPTEEKRIATGDEVMEFFTAVMKGEVKDAFDLPPSLQDRLNAAKELAKRTVDINKPTDEYEDDGFLDALNNQAKDVFAEAGDIVET